MSLATSGSRFDDYGVGTISPAHVKARTDAENRARYCAGASLAELAALIGAISAELVHARGMNLAAELSHIQGVVQDAASMEVG